MKIRTHRYWTSSGALEAIAIDRRPVGVRVIENRRHRSPDGAAAPLAEMLDDGIFSIGRIPKPCVF